MNEVQNERIETTVRLGKLPAKSSMKALLFDDFLKKADVAVPTKYDFWKGRAAFPLRTFGNTENGCCTIASQAIAAMRMERLETRQTPKITDDEVLRVYYALTERLYGGGDQGAYETDALSNWRNADLTFRDTKGRPLTIDAYTRINHFDHAAVKRAFFITGGKGIKLCFNLPAAWARRTPPDPWDIPEGQALIGEYLPGSWGGHSMHAPSRYNASGFWINHTWGMADQFVTWRAAAIYMDEVHFVIDSIDTWRKTKAAKAINFKKLVDAVNEVSSIKIK